MSEKANAEKLRAEFDALCEKDPELREAERLFDALPQRMQLVTMVEVAIGSAKEADVAKFMDLVSTGLRLVSFSEVYEVCEKILRMLEKQKGAFPSELIISLMHDRAAERARDAQRHFKNIAGALLDELIAKGEAKLKP